MQRLPSALVERSLSFLESGDLSSAACASRALRDGARAVEEGVELRTMAAAELRRIGGALGDRAYLDAVDLAAEERLQEGFEAGFLEGAVEGEAWGRARGVAAALAVLGVRDAAAMGGSERAVRLVADAHNACSPAHMRVAFPHGGETPDGPPALTGPAFAGELRARLDDALAEAGVEGSARAELLDGGRLEPSPVAVAAVAAGGATLPPLGDGFM